MLLTAKRQKARTFEETIAMLGSSGAKTGSGVYVNSDAAMRQSTVYSCVRILSEIIAQLPIVVQTRRGGTWNEAEQHDILQLLAEPNDWQTQHDLIAFLVSWSELEGNSYLYKLKNGAGVVRQVLPIKATSCEPELLDDMKLRYTVSSDYGVNGAFDRERIFHMRNFGTEGYKGLSTIGCHREGIGLAVQLESHAAAAYKNGLQTNKWLKLDRPLSGQDYVDFKAQIARYQGATATGEIPFIYDGEFKEFSGISAVDAQYIESRKLQKEEIASIYLVPLFLLNSTENTTWGSGLEQISRSFVRFSLNPRLNRIAQTIVREFVPEKARQRTRIVFDTDQFTLGEFKDRMDGYRSGIEAGVLTPNECRDIERRNPRDDGDKYRIPVNVINEGEPHEAQNTPQPADG